MIRLPCKSDKDYSDFLRFVQIVNFISHDEISCTQPNKSYT